MFALFALLGGCGGDDTPDLVAAPAEDSAAGEDVDTGEVVDKGTEEPEPAEAVRLVYRYEPGTRLTYRVEHTATTDISSEIAGFKLADMTGSTEIALKADLSYWVSEGPSDGTFEINTMFEVTDVSITGDVDVESVPGFAALGDGFATLGGSETSRLGGLTLVVDEQGTVLDRRLSDSEVGGLFDLPSDLFEIGMAFGGGYAAFNSPVLPADRALTEGGTWTNQSTTELFGQSFVADMTHRVADIQDERGLMLIETTVETSALTIDLGEFMALAAGEMVDAFVGEDIGIDVTGFPSELIQGSISIDEATAEWTTHLSYERSGAGPAAALVHKVETRSTLSNTVEVLSPDDPVSGADSTITVKTNQTQTTTFTLDDVSAG